MFQSSNQNEACVLHYSLAGETYNEVRGRGEEVRLHGRSTSYPLLGIWSERGRELVVGRAAVDEAWTGRGVLMFRASAGIREFRMEA